MLHCMDGMIKLWMRDLNQGQGGVTPLGQVGLFIHPRMGKWILFMRLMVYPSYPTLPSLKFRPGPIGRAVFETVV